MLDESLAKKSDGTMVAEQALSSEGPFASVTELVDYWSNTSTNGHATEIFFNGHRVMARDGFGPELLKQYFICEGGIIYATCPTGFLDGFSTFKALVSRSPTTATIYKDDTLYRAGTDPFQREDVTTCIGDNGFNGPVRYFKVVAYSSGFGVYSSSCYP